MVNRSFFWVHKKTQFTCNTVKFPPQTGQITLLLRELSFLMAFIFYNFFLLFILFFENGKPNKKF